MGMMDLDVFLIARAEERRLQGKKRVDRLSPCVDGRNACGGNDHTLSISLRASKLKDRGFPRPRHSGYKHRFLFPFGMEKGVQGLLLVWGELDLGVWGIFLDPQRRGPLFLKGVANERAEDSTHYGARDLPDSKAENASYNCPYNRSHSPIPPSLSYATWIITAVASPPPMHGVAIPSPPPRRRSS